MAAAGFDIRRHLSGPAAVLAGTANVVLQLSRPPVGYGAIESQVDNGSAMRHPLKRTRTTFTYLAVALLGDGDDRAAFRRAVDRQHAQVVSTPDSPVPYRAASCRLSCVSPWGWAGTSAASAASTSCCACWAGSTAGRPAAAGGGAQGAARCCTNHAA